MTQDIRAIIRFISVMRVWRLRSAAIVKQVELFFLRCIIRFGIYVRFAGMAKLVDALDLGSSGATHKSSSLFTRTIRLFL